LKYTDPSGWLIDNYTIYSNGKIFREETNDNFNTYTYENLFTGERTDLGTYDVFTNSKGERMIKIGNDANGHNDIFSWHNIISGNLHFEADAFAGLLGGIQNFYDNAGQSVDKVQFNQFMSLEKWHSYKSNRNSAFDVAFYSNNGKTGAITGTFNISDDLNLKLGNSFINFGLGTKGIYSQAGGSDGKQPYLIGTYADPHYHHFHFQGFDSNRVLNSPYRYGTFNKDLLNFRIFY
jgi:hypothetical protein